MDIARRVGDRASEGDAYLNLGIAHQSHGDFPKAIECFEERLNIASEAGDWAGISRANQYLRISYFALGDFLKAVEYRGHTGEAGEGRTYNINGNMCRPFREYLKQLHNFLVLPRVQNLAIHCNAKM